MLLIESIASISLCLQDMNFRTGIITGSIVLSLIASPATAFAGTYGSGNYNGGQFNVGQPTPTPVPNNTVNTVTSTVNNVVSSIASTISTWTCTEQAPVSAPHLYEVDTKGAQAILYFAPAGHPYTNYYVSFGEGSKEFKSFDQILSTQTSESCSQKEHPNLLGQSTIQEVVNRSLSMPIVDIGHPTLYNPPTLYG